MRQGRVDRDRRTGRLRADDLVRGRGARGRRGRDLLAVVERLADRRRWNRPARPVDDPRAPADASTPTRTATARPRRSPTTRRSTSPWSTPPRSPTTRSTARKTADAGLQGHRPRAERRARHGQPRAHDDVAGIRAQVRLRRRLVHGADDGKRATSRCSTRPAAGVDTQLALCDSGGAPVDPAAVTSSPAPPARSTGSRSAGLGRGHDLLGPRTGRRQRAPPRRARTASSTRTTSRPSRRLRPLAGQIVFTEAGFGNDKFLEIKNDSEVPVEMQGASAKLVVGDGATQRECSLVMPTACRGSRSIDPERARDHRADRPLRRPRSAATGSPRSPRRRADRAERQRRDRRRGLQGVINSTVAAHHSLQFVEDAVDEDTTRTTTSTTSWCRTFAADTKGAGGRRLRRVPDQ